MNGLIVRGALFTALGLTAPVLAQQPEIAGSDDGGAVESVPPAREDAAEQRPILVTASREQPVALEDFTGSVTLLTAQQLERRQVRDIGEVLRDVPGIAISEVAGQTQVRVRGSEANHVLVLVDGIEVSDPFAGEFDIGTLQAEIGSSVEVLRGPQSALYGSDAIGGVIAYRSGVFDGIAARLEGGSDNTINASLRAGQAGERWTGSVSATVVSTDGQPNARGGTRDIGRDSYTLSALGTANLVENLEVRAVGRFIRTEGRFNQSQNDPSAPGFGLIVDSPGTRFTNEAIYALVGARYDMADGRWTHDLSAQIADIARDTFGPFGLSNASEGDRFKASYVTAYQIADRHAVTFAADWEREGFRNASPGGFSFDGRREIENVGLVGEYRYDGHRLDLSAAIRHDINDRFADETTFRVGAGYELTPTTRLRAAAGSGIRNPGFFELFGFIDGRFIGNEDLKPEKSTSWEIGIDQHLFARAVQVSATWFDTELEDEIFTTFPPPTFVATPGNAETRSTQQGIELAVAARMGPRWSLDAAYTYLDAEENGVTEVRRPDHVASAALTWTAPADAASATLVVRHNGEAVDAAFIDPSFVPVRVTLDDYTFVDLNARVMLAEGLDLFARGENLLDERPEQVFSFVSPGRRVIAGVSTRF